MTSSRGRGGGTPKTTRTTRTATWRTLKRDAEAEEDAEDK